MKNLLLKLLFFTFIVVLLPNSIFADELKLYSPTYFNEQDNELEEISYLENELLSFEVCSKNGENFKAKYYCENQEENLELTKNAKNSCVYNNINFEDISCDDFTLEVTFQEDNRERVLKRDFSKKKESIALSKVLEKDISELNPLDLSYYLVLHTSTKGSDNKLANDIYDLLKNQRNNGKKCWPKDNCDGKTTAKILYNIQEAGYNKDSRLLDDGKVYLESLHLLNSEIAYTNSNNNDGSYEVDIEIDHNFGNSLNCDLTIDNGNSDSYSFSSSSDLEDLHIVDNVKESISFDCNNPVDKIHYNLANEIIFEDDAKNDDTISHTISSNDKNEFDNFELKLQFEHDFGTNDVTCDVTIDGDETTYNFDNQSNRNDRTIEKNIEEDFDVDCDSNMDYIRASIFAGDVTSNSLSSDDSFFFNLEEITSKKFDFEIKFDYDFDKDTLSCDLITDQGSPREIEFDKNDNLIIDKYSASSSFSLQCDDTLESIESYVLDNFGRKQLKKEVFTTSQTSFSIPNSFSEYECLGKGNLCDEETTMYALMTYNDIERNSQLKSFISSLKEKDEEFPLFQTSNPYIDSGTYLHIEKDTTLIESLKFLQNNDGSWNTGEKENRLLPTIFSKLGLSESGKNSEHVLDAQDWIYQEEPVNGWGSISENALAYLSIKDQVKPYVTISAFDSFSGYKNVTISNPTIFDLENLKVDFSKTLKDKILYKENLGSLSQNQKLNISLVPSSSVQEKITGELIISGLSNDKSIELIRIPVSIEQNLPFTIAKTSVSFTEDEKIIRIPLEHTSNKEYSYVCDISSPMLNQEQTIMIDQSTSNLEITNPQGLSGSLEINLDCSSEEKEGIITEKLSVTKTNKTFNTTIETIEIYKTDDTAVSLENLFETQQVITFSLSENLKPYLFLPEPNKMFAINETRDIFVSVNETHFNSLNETINGELTLSANKYTKTIPITLSTSQPESESGIAWGWWIVIGFVASFAILVLVRYRQLQLEEENQEEQDEELEEDIVFE